MACQRRLWGCVLSAVLLALGTSACKTTVEKRMHYLGGVNEDSQAKKVPRMTLDVSPRNGKAVAVVNLVWDVSTPRRHSYEYWVLEISGSGWYRKEKLIGKLPLPDSVEMVASEERGSNEALTVRCRSPRGLDKGWDVVTDVNGRAEVNLTAELSKAFEDVSSSHLDVVAVHSASRLEVVTSLARVPDMQNLYLKVISAGQ